MKRRMGLSRSRSSLHKKVKTERAPSTSDSDEDTQKIEFEDHNISDISDAGGDKKQSTGMATSTSLTDGLLKTNIRYPLKLPTGIFHGERRMRLSFYSKGGTAWMEIKDKTDMFYARSNFFEIPHNHMSFYLPTAFANDIFASSASKMRIRDCSWEIEKISARTFNEVNPALTTKYYQIVGSVNPAYEILHNSGVQPTHRKRMWQLAISRTPTFNNDATKIEIMCENSESKAAMLPHIIWQEPHTGNTALKSTFAEFQRHVTILEHNHKGYTHAPGFIKGWRRLCGSTNPRGDKITTEDPAPYQSGVDWTLPITKFSGSQTSNQSYLYHPVGGDCKTRKFHYRMPDAYYPNVKSDENPDVFIKIRDEMDADGSVIPMRIEMDIRSKMVVEVSYGFSIADQSDVRLNEPALELITNSAYSIPFIAGDIPE